MNRFSVLQGEFAVARLEPGSAIPAWATASDFYSVTRTRDELSIVCPAASVPAGIRVESGWVALLIEGPFPFEAIGVMASFANPLAAAGVSLLAISTFDTDYLLIKADRLDLAVAALAAAGKTRVVQ